MTDLQPEMKLAQALDQGKVLLMRCDTIYGLLSQAPAGYKALEKIKGRPENKPFLQLFASIEQLEDSPWQLPIKKLQNYWPGPLTCVLAPKTQAMHYLQKTEPYCWQESQAVRIPQHELLQSLCRLQGSLYSTSANRSGQPQLQEPQELLLIFASEISSGQIIPYFPELFISNSKAALQQTPVLTQASTIIDARKETPIILRQGDLKIDM